MQNEIDLSENNLLGRRAIAKIVAPFEPVILPPSPCENAWHVRKADGTAVIRCYGLENNGNDAIARMLAAHIATNSPEVFIAYTDEILRLRNELAATECREGEGDAYVEQLCLERDDLETQVARLEGEVERLNKEADWLVERLKEACKSFDNCFDCPFYDAEGAYCIVEKKPWREVAREAVEKKE